MTETARARVVIVDANVLINLIHVDRLDLLGSLSDFEFLVPEQVVEKVSNPAHAQRLRRAFDEGHLRSITSTDLDEIRGYAQLLEFMGKGEAACLAIAHARNWLVASDEREQSTEEVDQAPSGAGAAPAMRP